METVDLEMSQGVTFRVALVYEDASLEPIDISDYRAHMQIRYKAGAPVLIDLTSDPDGGITLTSPGHIAIYAGATQTALVAKDAVYDLHLILKTDPDEVLRVFGGAIPLTKAITVDE